MAEHKSQQQSRLQLGQPFNPFGLFFGIFIPEALVRSEKFSAGAKLTYGRLVRYAGKNGECFPAVATLASEIGMGARQVQRYLSELEGKQLIRRIERFSENGQATNWYEFLWHALFNVPDDRSDTGGDDRSDVEGVTDLSPKESHSEENHSEEKKTDSDFPPAIRTNRDSQPDAALLVCQLTKLVTEHHRAPTTSSLGRIIEAAPNKTPAEAITAITAAVARGYGRDSENGPRSFRWFEQVVRDYWTDRKQRDLPPRAPAMDTGDLGDLDEAPF